MFQVIRHQLFHGIVAHMAQANMCLSVYKPHIDSYTNTYKPHFGHEFMNLESYLERLASTKQDPDVNKNHCDCVW